MVKARRKIAKNKRNLIKKRKILSRVILLPQCLNLTNGTLGRNKDFLIFFDKEKMGIYNM